ncbi:MAG: peptidyl-prolyl cis-trans isomerase [Candidatus Omnitrophota bacterium]|nr:peptidyl-prolyl cis-trans isomerase [Candidatus Omnitrophota bacterium]
MIKSMRKLTKHIIWALIIAFALWGAGSMAIRSKEQKGPSFAGIIFNKKVSFKEYGVSYQACKNQAIMRYGSDLRQVIKYLDLEQAAWDRLILLNEIKKQKIKITNEEVVETIKNYPFFQKDGQFNKTLYNYLIKDIFKTTPQTFEAEIKDSLSILKLRGLILTKVSLTKEEVKNAYKKEFDKAEILYSLIKKNDFKSAVELSEDQLKNYYHKNLEEFRIPQQVNLEYAEFNYADFENKVVIGEKAITEYYHSHLKEFELEEGKTEYKPLKEVKDTIKRKLTSLETRKLTQQKTDEVSDEIFDNPDILDSLELKETGFFSGESTLPAFGWSPQLHDRAFSLETGEISDPISTPKGLYIIRLKEKKESYLPDFEEAGEKVKQSLIELKSWQLSEAAAGDYRLRIEQSLQKENIDFKEAAEGLSLEIKNSGLFTRTGYIPGIGKNSEFVKTAFGLKEGEISMPVKVTNGYAILWLIKYQPADEEKLTQEFDKYQSKVLAEKESLTFLLWFNELKRNAGLKSNLNIP